MRTRRSTAALVVGLALLLVACGGGSSDSSSDGGGGTDGGTTKTEAPASPSSTTGPTPNGGTEPGKGDVDCGALTTAAQQLLSVQLLAQLNSPENITAVKDGTIGNFDPAAFLAGMETLHQLDGSDGPLGDPKEAIDAYEAAAEQAQGLLEAETPTQADIDAYMKSIGSTSEFLGHQAAISFALDQSGC